MITNFVNCLRIEISRRMNGNDGNCAAKFYSIIWKKDTTKEYLAERRRFQTLYDLSNPI
jgi:hypothetical protein